MKFILCIFAAVLLSTVNCSIYSLYNKNRNFLHDLSQKDKVSDKAKQGNIVGERRQIDINDEHVSGLLQDHLGRLITGDDSKFVVDRIDEVSKQTVAGISYRVRGHYVVEGVAKDCTVSILERVWHESEKVIISAKCDDGSCYVTETYTCSPKSLTNFF